jgi:chorismate-pyruvate lyase
LNYHKEMDALDSFAAFGEVDLHSLGLIPRLLLISDGTLTDIVEAAFLEPITLVKLSLDSYAASVPVDALDIKTGDPVMRRKILLRGAVTGTNFVYAQTLIALNSLPQVVRDELVNSGSPIGRLWTQHKLETRKEMLSIWREEAGELAEHFGLPENESMLARTYRVFTAGQPSMLISEYFPENLRVPATK